MFLLSLGKSGMLGAGHRVQIKTCVSRSKEQRDYGRESADTEEN